MDNYEVQRRVNQISEKLQLPYSTVHWIYCSVPALCELLYENGSSHVSAEEICEGLIRDLRIHYEPPFSEVLQDIGIPNSEDVGRIFVELEAHGLINPHEDDTDEDFNDIYSADTIEEYMKEKKIKPRVLNIQEIYEKTQWCLYAVGFTLLIGSGINIVHETAGKFAPLIVVIAYFMKYKEVSAPTRFR